MAVWAIVPIKPLGQSKSRLSDILSRKSRAALSKELLTKTLQVLRGSPSIEKTLVVSRDTAVLALARTLGAQTGHCANKIVIHAGSAAVHDQCFIQLGKVQRY